jgi:hypothetical protein
MNPPPDPKRDALGSVSDVLKVLTSLASGVIVFSATIVTASASGYSWWLPGLAILALFCLVVSLGVGLFTQGYIPKQINSGHCDINDPSLRNSALSAVLSFFVGIALLAAVIAVRSLFPSSVGRTDMKIPSAQSAVLAARHALSPNAAATLASVELIHGADQDAERKNTEWHVRFYLTDRKGTSVSQADVFINAADGRPSILEGVIPKGYAPWNSH